MAFWQNIFRKQAPVPQFVKRAAHYVGAGTARWMKRDTRVYADEGFGRNGYVNAAVTLRAQALASIPLRVKVGDDFAPDHPLQRLLDRPNPEQGGVALRQLLTANKIVSGNTYLEAIRSVANEDGEPVALWGWAPYHIKAVEGSGRLPEAWLYDSGGADKRLWPVDPLTGQSNLLQWKELSLLDNRFGMSGLEAVAYAVDQHNSAGEWNQALLQNGANPTGMLTTSGLTPDEKLGMREQIQANMGGPSNAGKWIIGDEGMDYVQMGMSPKDMDWSAGAKKSATDIVVGLRVPIQLVGIEGSLTRENYRTARQSLYEDTVMPDLDELVAELNNWLVPMYKDQGLEIVYEPTDIAALALKHAEAMQALDSITFLTPNEKRERSGLEPVDNEEADQLWVATGIMPMGESENMGSEDTGEQPDDAGEGAMSDMDGEQAEEMDGKAALIEIMKATRTNG